MCVCVRSRASSCKLANVYVCLYVRTYACMFVCVHVCMHVSVCVCVYVRARSSRYMYSYPCNTHIGNQNRKSFSAIQYLHKSHQLLQSSRVQVAMYEAPASSDFLPVVRRKCLDVITMTKYCETRPHGSLHMETARHSNV